MDIHHILFAERNKIGLYGGDYQGTENADTLQNPNLQASGGGSDPMRAAIEISLFGWNSF